MVSVNETTALTIHSRRRVRTSSASTSASEESPSHHTHYAITRTMPSHASFCTIPSHTLSSHSPCHHTNHAAPCHHTHCHHTHHAITLTMPSHASCRTIPPHTLCHYTPHAITMPKQCPAAIPLTTSIITSPLEEMRQTARMTSLV